MFWTKIVCGFLLLAQAWDIGRTVVVLVEVQQLEASR